MSEGRLRSPRHAGRSLPCGFCLGQKEKKSDVSRAAAPSCYFCHFTESRGAVCHHLLPPLGKLSQVNQRNYNSQLIKLQATVLRLLKMKFQFKNSSKMTRDYVRNVTPEMFVHVCRERQQSNIMCKFFCNTREGNFSPKRKHMTCAGTGIMQS